MATISLLVNGARRTVDVDPSTPLLYVLRNDLGLSGPRFGCGLGQCGACTVIIRGEAVRSCIRPVTQVANVEITTLEGLARNGVLHPVQQAWIDEQVPACGFCQNGQMLTAKTLLDRVASPSDTQIREAMRNTLCRCMTYYRINAAVKLAARLSQRAISATDAPEVRASTMPARDWGASVEHPEVATATRESVPTHAWLALGAVAAAWQPWTHEPEVADGSHRTPGVEVSNAGVASLAPTPSRREFLRTSGVLVASVAVMSVDGLSAFANQSGQGASPTATASAGLYPDPDFRQLDSWIVIRPDNTATFYVGKTDLGQGTGTAFRQVMADELDIAFDNTSCVMGSTDVTVDQGGAGGSDALQTDGYPMRRVAAEARRVLLEMAATRFGAPATSLTVSDGIVTHRESNRRITYGELIGGKRFNVTLTGQTIDSTTGQAPLKSVRDMKHVGQSPQRYDIPAKVDGTVTWAVDVKKPGMVHARHVRPPVAGATLIRIDDSSVMNLPGFVRIVSKGNYVAVVFEREEQAVRAARQLRVEWKPPTTPAFPVSDDLFAYMRRTSPSATERAVVTGDIDTGLAGATTRLEARYDVPFQGHTAFGPAHAMADPSNDQLTIYSNDMKSYGLRNGVARFLNMPRDRVRVVWMDGPQAYGRTAADDAGFEAAFLAKELGRPVRVQWSREEETVWDTKGPAYAVSMRGGLDAQGNLVAFDYEGRAADHNHLGYNEPDTVLIAQLMGQRKSEPARGRASYPSDMYAIPNRRHGGAVVPLPLVWETPLRTGNLRDPDGPQVTFASESFIDELAAAAKADPLAFRVKLLEARRDDDSGFKRARSLACLRAAAEKFGWDPRPSPKGRGTGDVVTGRGMAYSYRGQTVVAQMVEVDVNRRTGRIWVKRAVVAHDCGIVINPEALTRTVENGLLHSLSRALHEEVKFDGAKITSVNWVSSPTLTHADVPERIDVVLVNGDPSPNRPDLPHYGAGETVCKPVLAAVANAVFDATGVRLRRVPFTATRVLAALRA